MSNPMMMLKKGDSQLHDLMEKQRQLTFSDGALSVREKLLIAMALDVQLGAENGVKSLAQAAMDAGASREQIQETLRVCTFVGGAGSLFPALNALSSVINEEL
ncbi:MAG: carboxymuconolactone decarboxylase family protein [Spirochaetes bacterium]|jgi:alkylhydroperoxidase/carboxymuconolactone decarboxylase family protein YurZ|nr:carboxymuconolactone decarboxylase family protein [Spirochaetota bacterium]